MQTIRGGLFHAMNQAQATHYEAYYLPLMCTIIAQCLLHKQVAMHHTRGGTVSGRSETIGIINEEEVEQVSQERQTRRWQVEVKLDITSRNK